MPSDQTTRCRRQVDGPRADQRQAARHAELGLAVAQRLFGLLALGDVAADADHADHLAALVAIRRLGGVEGARSGGGSELVLGGQRGCPVAITRRSISARSSAASGLRRVLSTSFRSALVLPIISSTLRPTIRASGVVAQQVAALPVLHEHVVGRAGRRLRRAARSSAAGSRWAWVRVGDVEMGHHRPRRRPADQRRHRQQEPALAGGAWQDVFDRVGRQLAGQHRADAGADAAARARRRRPARVRRRRDS